jgi:hypothetical protein
MHRPEAEAGTLEQSGWPGGELQDTEPTQRIITRRVRDRARGGSQSDDPYEILGVRRGATARAIRAAYLSLVKELHPDGRTPDPDDPNSDDADERLKAINAAYRKLKGGGAGARNRTPRAGMFVLGVLTSALPLVAIGGAYYAGWLGSRTPAPVVAAKGESKSGGGTTSVQKDTVVGRQEAFADAKKQATKVGWAKFIAEYPGGEPEAFARQAIAMIERAEESLAWSVAEKGTKADIQQFIARYADGEHAGKANLALAAIARAEALEARKQEERLAWAAAENSTKTDIQRFIAKYAGSELVGKAKLALSAIARAEESAWAAAEHAGTKEALQRFLDQHPDAAHAPLAGKALAAIADADARAQAELESWTKAKDDGSKAALRKYLSEYPSGRHVQEAKARVARLETDEWDEEAWRIARKGNSKAAYAGYLAAHPNGRRVTEAYSRLDELERIEMASKAEMKEARAEAVKAPPVKRPPGAAGGADEPFVGADGRIRR